MKPEKLNQGESAAVPDSKGSSVLFRKSPKSNVIVPFVAILFLITIYQFYGMLLFHTLAELFSVVVGIMMFMVVWNTKKFTQNDFLVFLGMGYFWVALLDSFHLLTMTGMPFFKGHHDQLTLHFWIYSRIFEAVILLIAPAFIHKKIHHVLVLQIMTIIFLSIVWTSFYFKGPILITSSGLSAIKVLLEYTVILVLIFAGIRFWRAANSLAKTTRDSLVISIILTILAEFSFTLYRNYDATSFVIGHLFKFLSFWLVYEAITQSTLRKPFRMMGVQSSNFSAIPFPTIIINESGFITQINKSTTNFLGLPENEIIGGHVHQFFHDGDKDVNSCPICQAIEQHQELRQYPVESLNGQFYYISLSSINYFQQTRGMIHSIIDVTEQKNAEQEVRSSHQRYRDLIESMPIGIYETDAQGNCTFVNNKWQKMAGMSFDQALGDGWKKALHPDDEIEIVKSWVKCIKKHEIWSREYRFIKADGKSIWVYGRAKPIFDSSGKVKSYIGTNIDISEQKESRQEMERISTEMQLIINTIPDYIWLRDPEGRYISCNQKVVDSHHESRESIIGKQDIEINDPAQAEIFRQQDLEVITSNKTIIYDETIKEAKDGKNVFVETIKTPMHDKDGNLVGVLGIARDITARKQMEIALKENEERLNIAMAVVNESIWDADLVTKQVFFDARFYTMTGYDVNPSAVSFKEFEERLHPDDREYVLKEIQYYITGKSKTYDIGYRYRRKSGRYMWLRGRGRVVETNEEGRSIRFVGTNSDITEQKVTEARLLTLYQAIEQSPVSVVITDLEGDIEYVNHAFEQMSGYSIEEVRSRNPKILKFESMSDSVYQQLWQHLSTGKDYSCELENKAKDGRIYWVNAFYSVVVDEHGNPSKYMAVYEDITLRKQHEDQLLYQAHFDSLTELPNRFLCMDRLSQLILESERAQQQVAVLYIDLDDFKKVNDSMGHEVGDQLLVEVSHRFSNLLRKEDTVGRLGGDEFIILLSKIEEADDSRYFVEKLLDLFKSSFTLDEREYIISASIGIAIYPNDGQTPSELLKNADAAMYHAKEQGRNTYSYYTDEMNRKIARQLVVEEQLHDALERNEFHVVFQQQVKVENNMVIGAEALLRWNNEKLGAISPAEFIPVAERTGKIVALGYFVLEQALKQTALWHESGREGFKISVNLSPRQFRDPLLVEEISTLLKKYRIAPQLLELEITEGVLLSGHQTINDSLNNLSNIGVGIAMDDFGTGYSSLSYLRSYPFTVLKVDQSFVRDITKDNADRELIIAAIAMAHGLNLKVVAEGVETEQQLQFLKSINCDIVQGYYFGKPVMASKFFN